MASKKGILSSYRNRGVISWLLALMLISFYVFLYWDKDLDQNFFWKSTWSNFENIHFSQVNNLKKEIEYIKTLSLKQANDVQDYNVTMVSIKQKEEQIHTLNKKADLVSLSIIKYPVNEHPSSLYNGKTIELDGIYLETATSLKDKFSAQRTLYTMYSKLDGLSYFISNQKATKWYLYAFLYTFLVTSMGFRFIRNWKKDKYQKVRTFSIIFFQLIVAFLIPSILEVLGSKSFYFHYFWPLKFDYIFPHTLSGLPKAMAIWTLGMAFIGVPILTYFYGKRWYCSWVCGCGALANTFGDPFRHLSDKSSRAWLIEKITVYSSLGIAVLATILIVINQIGVFSGGLQSFAFKVQKWYGFFISAGFAGVVGTGFYPIAGTRVWCRFGCPQAAILGILQKVFSRFRITTNGDQCMSCGNCSTYCEMGIDVRSYAMQGKDIVRAACVGCGLCMSVCPRGVLKLENGPRGVKL